MQARIRPSVTCSCSGVTSFAALVALVATRRSAVPALPVRNAACSGEPNRGSRSVFGRSVRWPSLARDLVGVSRWPMSSLSVTRASGGTQSTRYRAADVPQAGQDVGGYQDPCDLGSRDVHVGPVLWRCRAAGPERTRPAAVWPRRCAAVLGDPAARGASRSRRVRLDCGDVGAHRGQRGGELGRFRRRGRAPAVRARAGPSSAPGPADSPGCARRLVAAAPVDEA